jgi:ADP-heptose:LPS heptosyltransferase
VVDLGGATDLAGLAAVLDGAAVVVSGNTGPAHLAAAVGTPVVSIFAPVVPAARWRPWGVPVALLGDQDVPCAGCRARVCPFEGQPCLAPVTVDAVLTAVEQLAAPRPVVVTP